MTPTPILDATPQWLLFTIIVAVAMLMAEIGFRIGRWWSSRSEAKTDESAAAVVGATLGMLAFLIVFQTGIVAERFDTRRQLVIDEGNAI